MLKHVQFLFAVLLTAVLLPLVAAAEPPAPAFMPIDYPGALASGVSGINARGDMVGFYVDSATHQHRGFLWSGGAFTSIDYPGALITDARGINPQGDVVGTYQVNPAKPGGDFHGFLWHDGAFTAFDYPDHLNTIAQRITPTGLILGCFHDQDLMGTMFGMTINGTALTNTGVAASMNNGATPDGGLLAGLYTDMMTNHTHGYLLSGGNFTPFDYPGSLSTAAWDLSPTGDVVGVYTDSHNFVHGFLFAHGDFIPINYPGSASTRAFGINPQGDVVGSYVAAGVTHGFLVTGLR